MPRTLRRRAPRSAAAPLVALLALVAILAACSSTGATPGTMTASGAWARLPMGMAQTGAYVTITNGTGQADALVGASSPAATTVEVHESMAGDSGTMGMQPVASVPIAAGATLELKPGSFHIMLIGLTAELKAGDTIDLTLKFEKAAPVTVKAEVKAVG